MSDASSDGVPMDQFRTFLHDVNNGLARAMAAAEMALVPGHEANHEQALRQVVDLIEEVGNMTATARRRFIRG